MALPTLACSGSYATAWQTRFTHPVILCDTVPSIVCFLSRADHAGYDGDPGMPETPANPYLQLPDEWSRTELLVQFWVSIKAAKLELHLRREAR
ncbi:hypothetical protein NMY22_g3537 [Coprinellus aureogranulatus]|nr:hypothetical protein NMY22_g3537 [Coprinellus aureogranulatus]